MPAVNLEATLFAGALSLTAALAPATPAYAEFLERYDLAMSHRFMLTCFRFVFCQVSSMFCSARERMWEFGIFMSEGDPVSSVAGAVYDAVVHCPVAMTALFLFSTLRILLFLWRMYNTQLQNKPALRAPWPVVAIAGLPACL